MRSRKLALDADNFEEFKLKAVIQSQSIRSTPPGEPLDIRNPNIVLSKIHNEELNSLRKNGSWKDFEFSRELHRTPSWEEMNEHSPGLSHGGGGEKFPAKVTKEVVTKRCMVLGTNGVGKHTLINLIFGSRDEISPEGSPDQSMDLMIISDQVNEPNKKFQFWITNIDNKKFEHVVKVYYRSTAIFFFVYSVTDRGSLRVLEQSIQSVRSEVSHEKFVGVLVGTKSDLEKNREVSYEEGLSLKEKYGIAHFLETNVNEKGLKDKFQSL